MKNLLPLLLCFVTVYSKSVVPEPPSVPIGPFDETKDNSTSPIGKNTKLFQGDIVNSGRKGDGKIGEAGTRTPWPNAVIPYVFDCSTANIRSAREATEAAMKEWESRTCVRFVEKQAHHKVYLEFIRAAGCWATYVGYKGKKTQISIGNGCNYKHVMVHELGHVIGFWHEQSRPDRDQYIRIDEGNVIRSLLYNFDIVKEQVNHYGEAYDYASIMHYPWNAFAVDRRRNTIIPLKNKNNLVPYKRLSDSDTRQTNRMYKCDTIRAARASMAKKIGEASNRINIATLSGSQCADGHDSCSVWAIHGYCDLQPDPLLKVCAKSCGNCGPCQDNEEHCKAWADYGFCSNEDTMKYMWKNCKLSCKICIKAPTTKPATVATTKKPTTTAEPTTTPKPTTTRKTTTRPPTTAEPTYSATKKSITKGGISTPTQTFTGVICRDRSQYCPAWAKDGRCNTDRWVYDNCMSSCKRYTICDRVMIKPIGHCTDALGLYSKNIISDRQLYGSSVFSPGGGWHAPASSGRLYKEDDHRQKRVGAWCAAPYSRNSYFQIDLRQKKRITALATQGRDVYFEHVKSYTLTFSDDGSTWREYREGGKKKVFEGNCDHVTPVLNLLERAEYARYVRIHPIKYSGAACLRVELYGCN